MKHSVKMHLFCSSLIYSVIICIFSLHTLPVNTLPYTPAHGRWWKPYKPTSPYYPDKHHTFSEPDWTSQPTPTPPLAPSTDVSLNEIVPDDEFPTSSFVGGIITRCTVPKSFAITLDDGPGEVSGLLSLEDA
jgi:hypothetical protein